MFHSEVPGVPIKTQQFFTKHETISFCSIAKIFFDSVKVCINLNFDTLASPICKIFFEIHKSKQRNDFAMRNPVLPFGSKIPVDFDK